MADLTGLSGLQHIVRESEPLGHHTWLGVGGNAELYAEPTTEAELAGLLQWAKSASAAVHILGGGSNVLVPDAGVPGLVITLDAPQFCQIHTEGNRLTAGAGARLGHVVATAARDGLAGLEALVGIPGTLGGGVCTNCSGHGTSLGQWVDMVRGLGRDGAAVTVSRSELEFGYRQSNLEPLVVVEVEMLLEQGDSAEITRRMQKLWIVRRAAQPSGEVGHGKLFKDPQGDSASKLIEMAQLRGVRSGGASLHQADPNYVVLDRGAKSADVLALIETIHEKVAADLGVDLQPAIQIW